MAIMEVVDNIKDSSKKVLGDNGFIIFLGGFGFLFLVIYLVQTKGSSQKITTATSVTSYPDTVTNANVVISTLQDSTDYAKKEILDAIDSGNTEINSKIDTGFQTTQNYLEEGLKKQQEMSYKIDVGNNLTAMDFYKTMQGQGYSNAQIDQVLNEANFNTSNREGWWGVTSFFGDNVKRDDYLYPTQVAELTKRLEELNVSN